MYENNSLTHDQVDRLKTAIAATEIIPIAIYSPYFLVMGRKLAFVNTQIKFLKAFAIGITGFCICESASIIVSQKVWWPVTKQVYTELYTNPGQSDPDFTCEQLIAFRNQPESFVTKAKRVYAHLTQQ